MLLNSTNGSNELMRMLRFHAQPEFKSLFDRRNTVNKKQRTRYDSLALAILFSAL